MKIVTINVPESYIEAMEKLTDENGLYPSRSELIRCAVRDFLIKELKRIKKMNKYREPEGFDDDEDYVRVPVERSSKQEKPTREFKTYKIVKKLEY